MLSRYYITPEQEIFFGNGTVTLSVPLTQIAPLRVSTDLLSSEVPEGSHTENYEIHGVPVLMVLGQPYNNSCLQSIYRLKKKTMYGKCGENSIL